MMLLVLLKTQQRIMIAPTKTVTHTNSTQHNEHTSLVIRHGNDANWYRSKHIPNPMPDHGRASLIRPTKTVTPNQYNEHKLLVGRMRRGTRRNPAMKVEAKNET
ncbi:MAG: hypothetical protein ACJA2U_001115 [Marinomonas primoryensis]|jgi:hypothetical protein